MKKVSKQEGKALADAFMSRFSEFRKTKAYQRGHEALDARQTRSLAKDFSGKRKGGMAELRSIPGFAENEVELRKDNAMHMAILEAKRRSGLTQAEIAKSIGMPQSNVSRIEHSRVVSFDTFAAYLMACGFDFTIKIRSVSNQPISRLSRIAVNKASV